MVLKELIFSSLWEGVALENWAGGCSGFEIT